MMNTTGQSVLSDGISSQEEPVDIINSPLNRVVEDNTPMVSTDFDLLDLPCKEEEETITHGEREAGVEPAFDDTESHHIGPNIDSDSYQDRSVGFSKENVNDEGAEKEDSSYEHEVEGHHYSDSPYGDGENEEENVQHRYTDSPFESDDEDSEDEGIFMVDHIPTSYRDSPAPDDRDMDRAIGVMYGDDGRGPCPPMEEDEIVTTTRRRRTRRFRRRKKKHDEAPVNHRRRRQWCWLLLCCLLLLLLLLLIGGIAFGITRDDSDDPPDEEEDDGVAPDDDFTIFKPYEGITTTPMDPYTEDCYFGVNVFPHVAQQCKCGTRIDIIPDDVATLQSQVTEDINQEIYEGMYTGDPSSCDPANQALIWLSSGNTRDAGDLFQRFVLSLSYFQMNGTNWDLNNLWLSDDSECIWLGLQCNSRFQVNSFAVDTNNVKGSFPTEMVRLNGLNTLSITRNHMTGTIPPELFSIRNLENLFLYANQMRGSIPSEVANAKKLKILSAGNNLFAGTLVSEIGQVSTLEQLDIGFNEFWLRLPTEMGQLTNMKYLVIEDNRFSGPMPSEFGRMSNLETFLLSQNLMKGPLPIDLTNLSNLHEWRFAHTGLGGDFPTEFGQAMTNLHRLEMGGNNFRGTIMTEFGYMTQLSWLALNGNDLTGTIPTEIGHLVNMTRLSLQDTLIEGTIPSEIGLMTKLENLNIDKNNLTGRAPEEICALRALELNLFVTDCEARGSVGIVCPIPDCCTFCRRGESSNSSP